MITIKNPNSLPKPTQLGDILATDQRKLTAIVAADVVGYSRLIKEDDSGTLSAISTLRSGLIEPSMISVSGRLVNATGDGLLMEFPSSDAAIRFAIDVQRAINKQNATIHDDRKITYRIGVNVGDVIVDGTNIHGDGVNIAARLEAIAYPGGVCISDRAYGALSTIVPEEFEDGGERQLKNIMKPIRVWHWRDPSTRPQADTTTRHRGSALSAPNLASIGEASSSIALLSHSKEQILATTRKNTFIVFLSGPTRSDQSEPSAQLLLRIKSALDAEHFEVILGEDHGLEDPRLSHDAGAQDGELEYIAANCNAVIIVADGMGAFCELGLFSWHFAHTGGRLNGKKGRPEFFLLIDKKFESKKNYVNEGPSRAVNVFGVVSYVDFATYDITPIIRRVKDRRAVMTVDNKRGRPRKVRQ